MDIIQTIITKLYEYSFVRKLTKFFMRKSVFDQIDSFGNRYFSAISTEADDFIILTRVAVKMVSKLYEDDNIDVKIFDIYDNLIFHLDTRNKIRIYKIFDERNRCVYFYDVNNKYGFINLYDAATNTILCNIDTDYNLTSYVRHLNKISWEYNNVVYDVLSDIKKFYKVYTRYMIEYYGVDISTDT